MVYNWTQDRAQSHVVKELWGKAALAVALAHWCLHQGPLVKQLRENNVSLGKVYSIIGSFFLVLLKMCCLQRGHWIIYAAKLIVNSPTMTLPRLYSYWMRWKLLIDPSFFECFTVSLLVSLQLLILRARNF